MRVLVTGAAGNVGGEVVDALLERKMAVIAAGRRTEPLVERWGDAVSSVRLDFLDRNTWVAATRAATHLFLMRPPAIADVKSTLNPFVDFARKQGIDHVVFLSVAGAGKSKVVPHRKVEDHLRARGDHHTNLRPGFFAQNLESAYERDLIEQDRIYVPAGRKQPVNWIDVRDIAEVAAGILERPEAHRGKDYTLAGPGPISWDRVCELLSETLGRQIRYQPASVLGYVRHLNERGLPAGAILVQTALHYLLRFGQGATEDPTLEKLLGRPPRGMEQYVQRSAHLWATPNNQ